MHQDFRTRTFAPTDFILHMEEHRKVDASVMRHFASIDGIEKSRGCSSYLGTPLARLYRFRGKTELGQRLLTCDNPAGSTHQSEW